MAEEKKKPDLKSRLKGTMAGTPAPSAASSEPNFAPPPADVIAPPVADVAPLAAPPVASGGDDIAVPDFSRQQMAEKAAAEARAAAERAAAEARAVAEARAQAEQAKLAAMAADPFSSSATAGAQDIRLVIDDKAVSDAEVGRKNTGALLTAGAVGLVALVAGYLIGDFKSSKDEADKTRAAVTEIRRSVDTAGAAITALKDKVDAAATAAGIAAGGGEEGQQAQAQQQQAAAQATVDEGLLTWFSTQSPEPPLTPDVYAGRVGRLRPDLVTKLMKVQIELEQVWRDMQRHQALTAGPNLVVVRNSLSEAQRARTEFQRLAVVFTPGRGENAPPVLATLVTPTYTPTGTFTFPPVPGLAPAPRTVYASGDLMATINTVGIPVAPGAGVVGTVVSNLGRPWSEYVARLTRLRTAVDGLQNDHHQLAEALTRAGAN